VAVAFAVPLFVRFGLYRAIFRYAGWAAQMAVVRAIAIYTIIYAIIFSTNWLAVLFSFLGPDVDANVVGVPGVPRTLGLLQPLLLFVLVGGSRAVARQVLGGQSESMQRSGKQPKVMIYGAGSSGRQLAAALRDSHEMKVVGFIDDDESLHGSTLNGIRIFASADLLELTMRLGVSDILLAIPSATRARRNAIIDSVRGAQVSIRTLPGVMDLAQGRVTVSDLRELEIEDLLGRDAVAPHQLLLSKNITGKTVLVTGAGGSIGSELCRQILQLNPTTLLLVEMSEFGLYSIHQELEKRLTDHPELRSRVIPLLGSVVDGARMRAIMQAWRPQTLYHAAAYKHVPLVEHNPAEGIRNNVIGTMTTALVAEECGVRDFVLISTDKAVRPTNVMGTSKRLAEMILQARAASGTTTRFAMVRYGNVLGSSGSVVPLFRRQIREGGPITITHPEITRYFMTIPEAAQLVIQAGAMAAGGEVFVLDMGEPVKIIDLAYKMIELSGLKVRDDRHPDGDIAIDVVGLRPGEKLYEELLIGDNPVATNHPRVMKANEVFMPWARLSKELKMLVVAMDSSDVPLVRAKLNELVPEFVPDADVVDWIHMERAS
jgi:FlaA1/EpsC-like NDP-sugar epimerase